MITGPITRIIFGTLVLVSIALSAIPLVVDEAFAQPCDNCIPGGGCLHAPYPWVAHTNPECCCRYLSPTNCQINCW
jgi:hypothetical protein